MEGVAAVSTEKTKDIDYVEVCAEDELWDGEMDAFDVGDHEILLVHFGQQYFAYDGLCPHQSVALVDGELTEDGLIICGAHQWQFRADNGKGVNPANECLQAFPVKVENGRVYVGTEPE
ncbi:MAG: Rieske 2Fe-2S domain-containing protein [Rhodospirillaceae bacterium]|nr:Rieske 2Fe-2S domain-containing protein [Rhodospirillaceae bacterium]